MGIAFTMYGRLEEADPLVASLCADKDPILRRSGMYTLAMAYCGTGNNQAIRKLLHVAVSCREQISFTSFCLQLCFVICSFIAETERERKREINKIQEYLVYFEEFYECIIKA